MSRWLRGTVAEFYGGRAGGGGMARLVRLAVNYFIVASPMASFV